MGRIADFRVADAKALAERAGYVCSYPSCGSTTIGPSAESVRSTAKTGMACHIYAAADGPAARRVRPDMTTEELRSIENGIWMCYRHGKLIDADECTYAPELLKDWRNFAVRRAELRHAMGREPTAADLAREPLARLDVDLQGFDFIAKIADALELSNVAAIWGREEMLAVRDFVVELARNALTHGKATDFELSVRPYSIELVDDGIPFSLNDLAAAASQRGGSMSLKQLGRNAPGVVATYHRSDHRNRISLASTDTLEEFLTSHPCSTAVFGHPDSVSAAMHFIEAHPECGTIFLRPRFGMLSYSDIYSIAAALRARDFGQRDIALVIGAHSKGLNEVIAEIMPSVRVVADRAPNSPTSSLIELL